MSLDAFKKPGKFYKGNLHGHSTHSDGALSSADVVDAYRSRGYDFTSVTDHFLLKQNLWFISGREAWKDDPTCLTINDTSALRTPEFTTLLGAEFHGTGMSDGSLWHLIGIGLPLDFAPWDGKESGASIAKRAAESGAFVGIAHPAISAVTLEDAQQILPYADSIEIYNHASDFAGTGQSWHFADLLYKAGHRLTAYASDDAHATGAPIDKSTMAFLAAPGAQAPLNDAFGGWVQVKAESLTPEALLAALKAGDFYSSMGPEFHDISIEGDEISIACSPVTRVYVAGTGTLGLSIADTDRPIEQARFKLKRDGNSKFLRVTIGDANGRYAWSNPIWLD